MSSFIIPVLHSMHNSYNILIELNRRNALEHFQEVSRTLVISVSEDVTLLVAFYVERNWTFLFFIGAKSVLEKRRRAVLCEGLSKAWPIILSLDTVYAPLAVGNQRESARLSQLNQGPLCSPPFCGEVVIQPEIPKREED